MIDVELRPGRERSVERRHPWVMSGSIASVSEEGPPGVWVRVKSAKGATLGFGHWSPHSQIRVRMLSLGETEPGDGLIDARVTQAIDRRARDPLLSGTNAVRLINAEGDGLPGLVADRFDEVVVVKLTTAGMIERRDRIAKALERCGAKFGVERADASTEKLEGVAGRDGTLWGGEAPEGLWIEENGRRYLVDVRRGQKTGFYLDQRDARDLAMRIARDRNALDLYSHTGGFAVACARGGARSITVVESSKDALVLAEKNLHANAPDLAPELVQADVHRFLRERTESWDLLIVDPPPLAKRKKDVERAARAYKDAILHALQRAAPNAALLVFSCSQHVGADLFRKIVFGASLDAERSVQVVGELGAPSDHPVSIDHPEGAYLFGLHLRVIGR
jgi:23S rRNA (cytosine1962-C5)-methyltransferase